MKDKILVSSCLLGLPVRYDGRSVQLNHSQLTQWQTEGRIIFVCPEIEGGLPVPRPACEIVDGEGSDVLAGSARIMSIDHADKTSAFLCGAQKTLKIAKSHNIKIAILKQNSPSCGNTKINDGTFSKRKINGSGVTAALLMANGIEVFNECEIKKALKYLSQISNDKTP